MRLPSRSPARRALPACSPPPAIPASPNFPGQLRMVGWQGICQLLEIDSNVRFAHPLSRLFLRKRYDIGALAELIEIITPPLGHLHALLPMGASVIGGTHFVGIAMS